jgi:hypothetical protein
VPPIRSQWKPSSNSLRHLGISSSPFASGPELPSTPMIAMATAFESLAEAALARGDISCVLEDLEEYLSAFQIRLDHKSPAFRELGAAVLKAHVKALRAAVERRNAGEPIDTPKAPAIIELMYLDRP